MEMHNFSAVEAMESLEAALCRHCEQLKRDGMVELPVVALSGGLKSALVAAALNRHLPLRTFCLLPEGVAPSGDLMTVVEFLGTTHENILLKAGETVTADRLLQEAVKLGVDYCYSGDFITAAGLSFSDQDIAALARVYLPCLK